MKKKRLNILTTPRMTLDIRADGRYYGVAVRLSN